MEPAQKLKRIVKYLIISLLTGFVLALLVRTFIGYPVRNRVDYSSEGIETGQWLWVSKLSYGARTPISLLSLPFTDRPIYLSAISLPAWRLPALGEVNRQDWLVFNDPDVGQHPLDQRPICMRCCMALPGDTLRIYKGRIFVNGQPDSLLTNYLQFSYRVWTDGKTPIGKQEDSLGVYYCDLSPQQATHLAQQEGIWQVKRIYNKQMEQNKLFSRFLSKAPVVIPYRGMTIPLTRFNLALYFHALRYGEGCQLHHKGKQFYVNNKVTNSYTFKQDYYLVLSPADASTSYWRLISEQALIGRVCI